jgi:cytidine deaminase
MKKIQLRSFITELSSEKELSLTDRKLLSAARRAVQLAYAPYSNFKVGCAVLLKNGKIISGNNQENIAYPSGLCAERVAIFSAGANFPDVPIKAIAISFFSHSKKSALPITPCGACRQVIAEYESRHKNKIRIILTSEQKKIWLVNGIDNLLPFVFYHKEVGSLTKQNKNIFYT